MCSGGSLVAEEARALDLDAEDFREGFGFQLDGEGVGAGGEFRIGVRFGGHGERLAVEPGFAHAGEVEARFARGSELELRGGDDGVAGEVQRGEGGGELLAGQAPIDERVGGRG